MLEKADLDQIICLLNGATSWQKFMIDCTLHGYDAMQSLHDIADYVISAVENCQTTIEGEQSFSCNAFEDASWSVSKMFKPVKADDNMLQGYGVRNACIAANGIFNFLDMLLDTDDLDFILSASTIQRISKLGSSVVTISKADFYDYDYSPPFPAHAQDALAAVMLYAFSMKGINFPTFAFSNGQTLVEHIFSKTGITNYTKYMQSYRMDWLVEETVRYIKEYYKYILHVLLNHCKAPPTYDRLCNKLITKALADSVAQTDMLDKAIKSWQRRRRRRSL